MRSILAIAVLAACGYATSAPVPKEKEKVKDEEAILGTWQIVKFEATDKAPPQEELDKIRFHFKKDGVVTLSVAGREREGKFKLDSTTTPKSIDMINETLSSPGIYELDGDTFKLCLAEGPGAKRPPEFKSEGKRVSLVTFKRVKDEPKK